MPAEIRGYKIADTISLGAVSNGTQYHYKRDGDVISVLVSSYDAGIPLNTSDDTAAVGWNAVDGLRNTLVDARRNGQLTFLHTRLERREDFKANGHTARGWVYAAELRRVSNAGTVAMYYAVYAIPNAVVRVRVESPRSFAVNTGTPQFTKDLIAALVSQ